MGARGADKNRFKEIMARSFPELIKTINQFQETQQALSTENMMKTTPRCTTIRFLKTSDKTSYKKFMCIQRGKIDLLYKRTKISLITDFLLGTMQVRS